MTSDEFGDIEQLDENLRKWFKEKWVRFGPDGKIRGACARRSDSEGKPKCLPQKKAQNLGKKGRKYAASKKRREDPNPERRGQAKNVATKKKTNEDTQLNEKWSQSYKDSINCSNPKGFSQKAHCAGKKKNEDMMNQDIPFNECPNCRGPIVHESMINEKQDACYHKVKARYKVWPSAYASGALVQCRKKGAKNWGNKSKNNESAILQGIMLSESELVSVIYANGKPTVKYVDPKDAENSVNLMKKKHPNKTYKIKKELREASEKWHNRMTFDQLVQYIVDYIGPNPSNSMILDAIEAEAKNAGVDPDKLFDAVYDRVRPHVQEDYNRKLATEQVIKINTDGCSRDRQFNGTISEISDTQTTANQTGGFITPEHDDAYATLKRVAPKLYKYIRFDSPIPLDPILTLQALRQMQGNEKAVLRVMKQGMEKDTEKMYDKNHPALPESVNRFWKKVLTEMPDTSGPVGVQPGGRRTYRPKSAGEIEEDTAFAGGMGQGGNAGQSYRKFTPKSAGTRMKKESSIMKGLTK